ncbi:hypothetical protein KP509_1Z027200 [Ceratopteris richardii]|nr:hypothetical protein KP509_1Z027200 [Ceratopteris richardii]
MKFFDAGEITRIQSTSLTTLNVSHNSLSGMIPQKIGTCYILDLSNNNLSGNLSYLQYWTDMLEVLDLSHNRLNGQLMDEVPRFLRLRTLLLSNNELEGIIPSDYGSFPKLSYMDLSFNNLRGTIPASFFNTSSLFSLVLSNNLLEGEIPFPATHSVKSEYNNAYGSVNLPLQIGEGPQIAILDLSNNNLSGILSEGIGSLQKLAVLNLSHNEISGPIPIALCNLTELQDLDLSGNLLTGSIPDALPASLSVLALSGNNLSGTIPRNLKRFPEASFYPGNDGLTPGWASPDWKGPLNKSQKGAGRHGIIKAALIGGCVGALLFVIVIALFVFLRKSSMSDVHEKASNDSLADGQNHQKCAPCSGLFSVGIPARPTNMDAGTSSLNSILTDKITKPLQTEVNLDGRSQWVRKSIKDTSEGKSTDIPFAGQSKPNSIPESVLHHESLGMAGELHVDSPVVLKVQSPDRLAGELYFLDKSFIQCTAEDLSRAPAEVLGRSSHGTTYKATLDSGHVLTVKWLREGLARSKKEFTREAKKFSRIRHPNLNPLRGYYWGPQEHEKLILWDYVRSGSLAAHLADSRGLQYTPLSWQQRWIIATDVARGLVYLHNDRHLPHGNLKATNVLINGNGSDLSARLSDYSLHLLMTPEGTATQILNAGALGYRAPELAAKKRPTPTLKGDIYAYGVLILELLTGKGAGDIISGQSEAVDLTDWVKLQASERRFSECLDPIFSGESIPQGTEELVDLALRCISPLSSQRPNIGAIFEELSFLIASLLKVQ